MDAYTGFAKLYDLFMDNIDYDSWCRYLHALLLEYGISDGILLDLGCGTGIVTEYFSGCGYDMIGIDNSPDMLEIALEKRVESGHDILYLNQDMREFELYGTVAAVFCICDSLNYITEYEELVEVFRLVNNYLDPNGVFIFDLNTSYKFQKIKDSTIAENREEGSFIWENSYFEEEHINEYALTIFAPCEDGRYEKYEEIHYERAYSLDEIKSALSRAGLSFTAAYDAFTHNPPTAESERIYVIAREHGKERTKC
jgi:SAM-dependent methyltransferase